MYDLPVVLVVYQRFLRGEIYTPWAATHTISRPSLFSVDCTRLQHDGIASGLPLVERNYGNAGVQQPLPRVLPGAEAAPADWHEELRQGEGVRTDVESSPTPEGPHTIEA